MGRLQFKPGFLVTPVGKAGRIENNDCGGTPATRWPGRQCESLDEDLDLITQYRTTIKKIPRKVPAGTFCMKSRAFAATDEIKPPLPFPRMIFSSTHRITNRKLASIASQPNFIMRRIISM
jgi:hypothetical protein